MHGGKRSGAPKGNTNAIRHGLYTQASQDQDREVRMLIGKIKMTLAALGEGVAAKK